MHWGGGLGKWSHGKNFTSDELSYISLIKKWLSGMIFALLSFACTGEGALANGRTVRILHLMN
jgi:hypothetical protein